MRVDLTPDVVRSLKVALRDRLPHADSAPLTEALARGLGYSSNAALRADLERGRGKVRADFDDAAFLARLRDLQPGRAFADQPHVTAAALFAAPERLVPTSDREGVLSALAVSAARVRAAGPQVFADDETPVAYVHAEKVDGRWHGTLNLVGHGRGGKSFRWDPAVLPQIGGEDPNTIFPGTTAVVRGEVESLLNGDPAALARAADRAIEQRCAFGYEEPHRDAAGRLAVGLASEVVGGWLVSVAVFPSSARVILESEPGEAVWTADVDTGAATARRVCELVDRHPDDDAVGIGDVIAAIRPVRAELPPDMPDEVAALFGMVTGPRP